MKTGIQKVSIYDPATGTVVQFNNISTEAEFNKAGLETENSKGQMLYSGDESSFEFTSFDENIFTQLEAWMESETDLNMAVLGVDDNILWYEPSKITVNKSYLSAVASRNGYRVKISKKGGQHNIYSGVNMLNLLNGWADSNLNGLADGYTKTGVYTPTFVANSYQQISALAAASGLLFTAPDFIFPIVGAKLQLSTNIILVTNGTGLNVTAALKNFAGATLQTDTVAIATGLIEFTTPANFYKATINLLNGTVGASALTYRFQYPYIGVPRGAHIDLPY
jgi:hypothetical protein